MEPLRFSHWIKASREFFPIGQLRYPQAIRHQRVQLDHLLRAAVETEFGRQHRFGDILDAEQVYEAFASRVPFSDYSGMHDWWVRSYQGEPNITWPGVTKFFALSSGTTEGASKYIPVTKKMLRSILRTSRRQLIDIIREGTITDFLAKDYLAIGGSTDLHKEGTSYAGDLSGITTSHMPIWFKGASKPDEEIRKIRDWQEKMDRMVEQAPEWDIVIIAGVPAWIKLLIERIMERYQLNSIHDIWPRFSVYIHGGVSIDPYRKSLDDLFGKPVAFYETYLASEGFLAWQSRKDAKGMRLNVRAGIFFEFIAFTDENFDEHGHVYPHAEVTQFHAVQEHEDYALVISTCAGAWRYLIGDVIRFVDLQRCEIKIMGRTRHFLSLCGEHLSVDNMNHGIQLLAEQLDLPLGEFTVKGVYEEGQFAHRWYIGCETDVEDPMGAAAALDRILSELNDDYAVERKNGALKQMTVDWLPASRFMEWMDRRGKLGSQNKVPRVMTDAQYEDWLNFLKEHRL